MGVYLADRPNLTETLLRRHGPLHGQASWQERILPVRHSTGWATSTSPSIERDLRWAIETKRIGPWFQPIVRLDTEALVGIEALLRWSHPVHGAISPPEIITAARESGMLQLLTNTVFSDCCDLIAGLMKADRHEVLSR